MTPESGVVKPQTAQLPERAGYPRKIRYAMERLLARKMQLNAALPGNDYTDPIRICRVASSLKQSQEQRQNQWALLGPGRLQGVVTKFSGWGLGQSYGFVPHLLRDAARDRKWAVLKFEVDGNLDAYEVSERKAELYLNVELDPRVEYAYFKNNCLTVVLIERCSDEEIGWFHFLNRFGVTVTGQDKAIKRLSQVDRSFLCHSKHRFQDLQFVLIDKPETWTPEIKKILDDEFEGMDAAGIEKATDGMAILSVDPFYHAGINNLKAEKDLLGVPGALVKKARSSPAVNLRMLVPGRGQLKCQVLWSSKIPPRTVITHSCNFKKEMQFGGDQEFVWVYWDPQPGKDESRLNVQYLLSQRFLFPSEEVLNWLEQDLDGLTEAVKEGRFERDLCEMLESIEDRDGGIELDSFSTQTRLQAMEWLQAGGNLLQLPRLLANLYSVETRGILDPDSFSIRVRIPWSVHWQIVTSVMVRLADPTFPKVTGNKLRFHEAKKLAVVASKHYGDTSLNLGGGDLDDFAECIIRRNQKGQKLVFGMRCPNDHREYGVWYLEGEIPAAYPRDTEIPLVPEGLRIENAARVKIPIPKVPKEDKPQQREPYSLSSLRRQLEGATTNPGFGVLVREFQTLVYSYNQIPAPPVSLEETVDTCTQGGESSQINWVMGQWRKALITILEDQSLKLPWLFWKGKLEYIAKKVLKDKPELFENLNKRVIWCYEYNPDPNAPKVLKGNAHWHCSLIHRVDQRLEQWLTWMKKEVNARRLPLLSQVSQESSTLAKYRKQVKEYQEARKALYDAAMKERKNKDVRGKVYKEVWKALGAQYRELEEVVLRNIPREERPWFVRVLAFKAQDGVLKTALTKDDCLLTPLMWEEFMNSYLYDQEFMKVFEQIEGTRK